MIVVVGNPVAVVRTGSAGIGAGGPAVAIARAAAAQGSSVQLVGRIGDDEPGDAVVVDLGRSGVGHAAIARVAGILTTVADGSAGPSHDDDPFGVDERTDEAGSLPSPVEPGAGPDPAGLDRADLDVALRYLGSYATLVVVDDLTTDALRTVLDDVRYAGASLVVVRAAGSSSIDVPNDATILEAPSADLDGSFVAFVGRLAAALDRGTSARAAFDAALSGSPI